MLKKQNPNGSAGPKVWSGRLKYQEEVVINTYTIIDWWNTILQYFF